MVSALLSNVLRKISAILVTCDPPNILNGSTAALQRDALNGNPALVLGSSDSQIFHVGMKESRDV